MKVIYKKMSDMYSFQTSFQELEAINQGMMELEYKEITPQGGETTGSSGDKDFNNTDIYFNFEIDKTRRYFPSKAYIKTDITITDASDNQIDYSDNIAIGMNATANFWDQAEFKINDKAIDKIENDYPQASTLLDRLLNSKSWFDSNSITGSYWNPSFYERQKVLCDTFVSFGDKDEGVITAQSALGLIQNNTVTYTAATKTLVIAKGAGASLDVATATAAIYPGYSVTFNSYKLGYVKTITSVADDNVTIVFGGRAYATNISAVTADGTASNIKFDVLSTGLKFKSGFKRVRLYYQPCFAVNKLEKAFPLGRYTIKLHKNGSWKTDIIESIGVTKVKGTNYKCELNSNKYRYPVAVAEPYTEASLILDLDQIKLYNRNVSGTASHDFTFTVPKNTFAFSAFIQDSNAESSTLYSKTKFKTANNDELKMKNLRIEYANTFKPDMEDVEFTTGTQDSFVEKYAENLFNQGSMFDQGGAETYEEWKERGPYYHFLFPKDPSNTSTDCRVKINFSSAPTASKLWLASHFKRVIKIEIKDQMVDRVSVSES